MDTLSNILANTVLIILVLSGITLIVTVVLFFIHRIRSYGSYNYGINEIDWIAILNLAVFCSLLSVLLFTSLNNEISPKIVYVVKILSYELSLWSLVLLAISVIYFVILLFSKLDDEDNTWRLWLTFLFSYSTTYLCTVLLLKFPMKGVLPFFVGNKILPLIAYIHLSFATLSGLVFFIGMLWRIAKGGESIYVSSYRKMVVLFVGGLLVFVSSMILMEHFQLSKFTK
jgi:hypothetical protein